MTTQIFTPHTILSHFYGLSENIKGWKSSDDERSKLFTKYILPHHVNKAILIRESSSQISGSAATMNNVLKKEGFESRINELKPGEISLFSSLELVHKCTGEACVIRDASNSYSGVKIKTEFKTLRSTSKKIICFTQENGDEIYIATAEKKLSDFALLKKLKSIHNLANDEWLGINSVALPLINIKQRCSIDWLRGMMHPDNGTISSAFQKINFSLVRQKRSVKKPLTRTIRAPILKNELIVSKPFYIWITRGGEAALPILLAYIDVDSWKKSNSDID
ncbi:hypothetical protein ACFL2R_01360 [Patescibacteria group bacterium]